MCVGRLEVDAELHGECVSVGTLQVVVGDVGKAELVGQFEVDIVPLATATEFQAHVGMLEGAFAEGTLVDVEVWVLDATADGIGEVRAEERHHMQAVDDVESILNQDGEFQVVEVERSFVSRSRDDHVLSTALGEANARLDEHGNGVRHAHTEYASEGQTRLRACISHASLREADACAVIEARLFERETATACLGKSGRGNDESHESHKCFFHLFSV